VSHLLLGLAMAVGAPQAKDPPKKDDPLVGEWALESMTVAGRPVADRQKTVAFTKDGKHGTVVAGQAGPGGLAGTYAHDPKKDPAELDVSGPAGGAPGRTSPAIYKIEGDTLTICSSLFGRVRPTTFDAPAGSDRARMVYKRVKDK
jgi:uncharacterized protein (TIGR03067 family)